MKYRIMEDSNGKYVQYKRFGIWRNFLIPINNTNILGKMYYDNLTIKIEIVNRYNTIKTTLLKEFEV